MEESSHPQIKPENKQNQRQISNTKKKEKAINKLTREQSKETFLKWNQRSGTGA